jgi:hypothetical protein
MCLIAEIIHTCSHEKVAQAAVASLGSDFAGKVGATAGAYGLSIGAFTARTVREFETNVGEREKQALRAIMARTDQPILTGLQHILSARCRLNKAPEASFRVRRSRPPDRVLFSSKVSRKSPETGNASSN